MEELGNSSRLVDCPPELSDAVLDAATAVHSQLGPGLLESVYESALMLELEHAGIAARRQVPVPVLYRGHDLGVGYRADVIVDGRLALELKCIDAFLPVHLAQMITYLKLLRLKRGYLINFNRTRLKEGIKRVSI
jgi:GxxExxY protein